MTSALLAAYEGLSVRHRVLAVDDEPHVLSALRRALRPHDFDVLTAPDGEAALRILEGEPVDAIISDMRMPGICGAQLLRQARQCAPDALRILLTGQADLQSTLQAVNEGEVFRYLLKPWEDVMLVQSLRDGLQRRELERERDALRAQTLQQNEELRRLNEGLEATVAQRTAQLEASTRRLREDFGGTVRLLSSLISSRAGVTRTCPPAVARLARSVALALDLPAEQRHDLTFAALLQDIGRLGLGDELLRQPLEALGAGDRARVLRHPQLGHGHLMALPSLAPAACILAAMYENFDGSGVPAGKRGPDIALPARVLRVATDYVHLTHGAMAMTALSEDQALRQMRRLGGQHYDPVCLDGLLKALNRQAPEPARQALVASANLRPGMTLARDLVAPSGTLWLAQGHVLDAAMIEQIHRMEELTGDFLWITVVQDDGREVRLHG